MNETLMLYLFTRINAVHGVIVVGLSVMAVSLLVWNMHRYIEEELPITVPVIGFLSKSERPRHHRRRHICT